MGKTNGRPRMGDGGASGTSSGSGEGPEIPASEIPASEITVKLPIGDGERPGFQQELVAAGELSINESARLNVQVGGRAAAAFVRVRNGLRAQNAKLRDGRPVFSNADALRFMLEAVADQAERKC